MIHSIVVGGTKGPGRVIMRLLAKRGDKVSVLGRKIVSLSDLELKNVSMQCRNITVLSKIEMTPPFKKKGSESYFSSLLLGVECWQTHKLHQ